MAAISTEWDEDSSPAQPIVSQQPVASPLSHGRLSVSMSRRISTGPTGSPIISTFSVGPQHENRKLRNVHGRSARVFWDLESCPVSGQNYFADIIRSIDNRVASDVKQDVFEIYAVYGSRSSLPPDIAHELQTYEINFNLVEPKTGNEAPGERRSSVSTARQEALDDDLFEQMETFIESQSQRSHLYPYVLLITGSVNLLNRMVNLERQAKIVYAVRKERISSYKSGSLGFEYSPIKGIDNTRNGKN